MNKFIMEVTIIASLKVAEMVIFEVTTKLDTFADSKTWHETRSVVIYYLKKREAFRIFLDASFK